MSYIEIQFVDVIEILLLELDQLNIGKNKYPLLINKLKQADISLLEILIGALIKVSKTIKKLNVIIGQARIFPATQTNLLY